MYSYLGPDERCFCALPLKARILNFSCCLTSVEFFVCKIEKTGTLTYRQDNCRFTFEDNAISATDLFSSFEGRKQSHCFFSLIRFYGWWSLICVTIILSGVIKYSC